eukprot:2513687-Amphidinium_carterae.1
MHWSDTTLMKHQSKQGPTSRHCSMVSPRLVQICKSRRDTFPEMCLMLVRQTSPVSSPKAWKHFAWSYDVSNRLAMETISGDTKQVDGRQCVIHIITDGCLWLGLNKLLVLAWGKVQHAVPIYDLLWLAPK